MRTLAGLILPFAIGCSNPVHHPVAPPDLSGVVDTFAPSKVPVGQAAGLAYQLPLGADAASTTARAAELDHLTALHVGVVRRDFLWSQLEPTAGAFDFTAEDPAVDETNARGIATIGLLAYNVKWAATMNGQTPADPEHVAPDPMLFAAFAGQVASHFKGRIHAWEIWNEENSGFRFWQPREDASQYAALLVASYQAIKKADPSATVIWGGMVWHYAGIVEDAESFFEDAYLARADLGRFYDVLGIHPYETYPSSVAPEVDTGKEVALGRMLSRVHALLEAYGDGKKPVWVTENGFPVYGPIDEPLQARFTVRALVETLAAGADRACIYTLHDGPHPTAFPPEDAFGLLFNTGQPKQAFGALQALLSIDPTAVLVTNDSTPSVRSYGFVGQAKRFHVVYSPDESVQPAAVAAAAGAQVMDAQGRALTMTPSSLMVDGSPVYVIE